jgi:hypothetical protein
MGNQKRHSILQKSIMKARYIDNDGEIYTEIIDSGNILKLRLKDYEFTSKFLDDFTLSDNQQIRDNRFQFNTHGELTNYTLLLEIPIRLSIDSEINFCSLQCELKVNRTKDNYNDTIANCKLRIDNKLIDSGSFDLFETGLNSINKQLPENAKLICCFNCLFSDYSVYGQGFWGTMSCFKNIKDKYLKVRDKDGYMEIMENYDRIVSETHYCNEYTTRIKGTGYRG